MIKLHVWGGAGEHGRSCYRIESGQHSILLDCGGKKVDHGEYPLLEREAVPKLTAVFLSHAHEDHCAALPLLYKYGYTGVVWTTRATVQKLPASFASWQKFVESRGGRLPYEQKHIQAIKFRYLEDYAQPLQWASLPLAQNDAANDAVRSLTKQGAQTISDGSIRVLWGRTGHLAGSIWIRIVLDGESIFFSGDYSRESELLAADPPLDWEAVSDTPYQHQQVRTAPAVLSIIDNAYGTDEEPQKVKMERLYQKCMNTLSAGGRVLLPVPAFGRSQDLLIWACDQLQPYPIIVEASIWEGLARLCEDSIWLHAGSQTRIVQTLEQHKRRLIVASNEAERLRAWSATGPCLILANDGMLESPSARWYYDRLADGTNNLVLLTGHASRGTFARKLLDRQVPDMRCRSEHHIYKVHQGLDDVRVMLKEAPASKTVLVHAPEANTRSVCEVLRNEGILGLQSLRPGMTIMI